MSGSKQGIEVEVLASYTLARKIACGMLTAERRKWGGAALGIFKTKEDVLAIVDGGVVLGSSWLQYMFETGCVTNLRTDILKVLLAQAGNHDIN